MRSISRWARRHPHLLGIACGILASLPFLPLLRKGFYAFDVDVLAYAMPIRAVAAQALTDGHFPLWDAYAQCGQSLSGDPASLIFYPLFWLTLGDGGWGGFVAFTLLHYMLLGWTAYLFFARGLRCRPAAALLGSITLACSGYFFSMFFAGRLTALPWLLLASTGWICGVRKGRADAALLAGVSLAMAFLAGQLQHLLVTLACLIIGTVLYARPKPARLFCGVRTCVFAGVTAFCICLIPMQQIWRGHTASVRQSGIQYETATRWSTHPLRALELATPYLWGVPHPGEPYVGAAVRRARKAQHHMDWAPSIFLGTAFLFLLPLPVRRCRKRLALGVWMLTGSALFLALGRHGPGHEAVYTLLPPLQIFRYPEKWLAWVTIGLAILSALKLEAYRPSQLWRLLLLPGLALVLLWLVTAVLPLEQADPRIVQRNNASIAHLLTLTLLIGVAAYASRQRQISWPVCLILLLSLIAGTQRVNHMRPPGLSVPDPLQVNTPIRSHVATVDSSHFRLHRKDGDILEAPALRTPEGAALRKIHLQERAAPALSGLRSTSGLHPNETAHFTMLQELLAKQPWKYTMVTSARFVSMPLDDAGDMPLAATDSPFGTALIDVQAAPPRVRLLSQSHRAASRAAALNMIEEMPTDAFVTGAVIQGDVPALGLGELQILQERSGLLRATVSSAAGTVLYYGDCLAPGWRAWVDGQPVAILPANLAFMAVFVPSGVHEIELRYCWY
jgi:hypothetical protein